MIYCVAGETYSRAAVNCGGGRPLEYMIVADMKKRPLSDFPTTDVSEKFVSMENISVLREFLGCSQLMTHVAEQLLAFLKDVQIDE